MRGKDWRLILTDITAAMNQAEWELQFLFPRPVKAPFLKAPYVFGPVPGWFARHREIPSMVDDPYSWIAAVVESARAVADKFPTRPVVIWMGGSTVWEGHRLQDEDGASSTASLWPQRPTRSSPWRSWLKGRGSGSSISAIAPTSSCLRNYHS